LLIAIYKMNIKENTNSVNSPQILTLPVENHKPILSINIDVKDNWLYYSKYYPIVYGRCFDILHNEEDAKDMAHDVFTHILEKIKSDKQFIISFPKTYLSKAATNMSINEIKREKKTKEKLSKIYNMATTVILNRILGKEEQEIWETNIIENGYEKKETIIIIKNILDEQDETTRKIYFCYYHDGMTYKQIGKTVGFSTSAVQKRLKNLEKQVSVKMENIGK